jgi:hypothetical protein
MAPLLARERVRCSSLVDWPVYPRLRRIYALVRVRAQCGAACGCAGYGWPAPVGQGVCG